MLRFKIKQDENVSKIKLNKRLRKTMQIAEDLNGIIATGNDAVALRWNNNPETSNKEAGLSNC